MKYNISIIVFCSFFLFFSCAQDEEIKRELYIVDILSQENTLIGKGVIVGNGTILTNTHILPYIAGQKIRMNGQGNYTSIDSIQSHTGKDITEATFSSEMLLPKIHRVDENKKGDKISAMVSRSGSLLQIHGHILETQVRYMGYDSTLTGQIFTGAIESDLVLLPGESGTPVWNEVGELVGIISAVDTINNKSYIVQ